MSTDGRCGTCKHWQTDPRRHGNPPFAGRCALISDNQSKGATLDAGDYATSAPSIETSHDWGCVEWHAKDETS